MDANIKTALYMITLSTAIFILVYAINVGSLFSTQGQIVSNDDYHLEDHLEDVYKRVDMNQGFASANSSMYNNSGPIAFYSNTMPICSNSQRIHFLTEQCEKLKRHGTHNVKPVTRFVVDDNRKLVYCSISKAGCTQMTALLLAANTGNKTLLQDRYHIHKGYMFEKANLKLVFELNKTQHKYKKILLVRDPYSRAISAFHNLKVGLKNLGPGKGVYGEIQTLFPNASGVNNRNLRYLRLKEYMQFLTNPKLTSDYVYRDRHFLSMTESCDICNIQYDHLLRLETFDMDIFEILKMLNLPENYLSAMPQLNRDISFKNVRRTDNVRDQFRKYLPKKLIDSFVRRFELDLFLLGYDAKADNSSSSCDIASKENNYLHCC